MTTTPRTTQEQADRVRVAGTRAARALCDLAAEVNHDWPAARVRASRQHANSLVRQYLDELDALEETRRQAVVARELALRDTNQEGDAHGR